MKTCAKCAGPLIERRRSDIADALRKAVLIAQRQESDWTKRFQTLAAHLLWLEAELRSFCTNCVLAEAADEFAALSVTVAPIETEGARGGAGADQPAEPGAPSGGRVIPLRRDLGVRFRGTVYEQSSAGEQLHATCRADAPEGGE